MQQEDLDKLIRYLKNVLTISTENYIYFKQVIAICKKTPDNEDLLAFLERLKESNDNIYFVANNFYEECIKLKGCNLTESIGKSLVVAKRRLHLQLMRFDEDKQPLLNNQYFKENIESKTTDVSFFKALKTSQKELREMVKSKRESLNVD